MFKTLAAIVAACCLLIASSMVQAQAAAKVTHLIVAFPPGGPVDSVGRILAEQLSKELGQTVVVENKAGANGNIGAEYVARAPADGSVLFLTSVGAVAISPALYPELPYDPLRDFAPVSLVVNNATVMVVNPANPATTAAEFVAASRQAAEPVAVGSSGVGSIPHLTLELFEIASKAKLSHVPYKGAAPVINDVMGNHVSAFFGDLPGLISNIRGGRLKPIGIAAAKRHPLLPEVKTLAEQGIEGVESNNWYAIVMPARTPKATIDSLNAAVTRSLQDESVRSKLVASGAEPAPSTPEQLGALIRSDTAKWGKIVKDKAIKAE